MVGFGDYLGGCLIIATDDLLRFHFDLEEHLVISALNIFRPQLVYKCLVLLAPDYLLCVLGQV